MNLKVYHCVVSVGVAISTIGLQFCPRSLLAQVVWPGGGPPMMAVPQTPDAQRNALQSVRAQVGWLQNATRTASSYGAGGVDVVWQQFQILRGAYSSLTVTLNQRQVNYGANELAELSAGLDILQEAFTNYQDDVANGRPATAALRDMCQVLSQAANVWLQELNRDCARLRVGW